ncbi:MAG: hypothetical protein K6B44_14330 [Lachnospiraceae bacterium]|nr:hypothetical protein [Lachnospiraceae bacterium]
MSTVPDNKEKVIRDFREEIKSAYEPGAKVMSADRELRYCLELQRDRLVNRRLTFKEEMVHRGQFPGGLNNVRSWKDGHYETSWAVDFIDHNKTYQRDGMITYKKTEKQSMYETVVDVREGEDVSEDTYCCPNCGAVSTIAVLQEGCPYCRTSFKMSELFPKISNYFFVYDISGKADNLGKTVLRYGCYLLPVNLALFLGISYFQQGITPFDYLSDPGMLIKLLVGMAILTPVLGFFGWIYSVIFDFIRLAKKDLPVLFSTAGSRGKFAYKMSAICPEFTFEYFTSRITSLFKIVVFSDHDEGLPFYRGPELGSIFDDVVDVAFRGSMGCKRIKEKDDMVYVTADIYVETAHDLGRRIKVETETYRITAGRRTDIPFSTNFSITKIQCRNCGGSFNIFKSKKCPFCGSEYQAEYDDWAIYDIKKI